MNKKTVIVIPGSDWQIPIVKKIKEMGCRALVVNPYKDSPAFKYSDGFLQCDIFDANRVISYCRAENADAILSEECDIAMPAVAGYAETLGLTALSKKSAHLFTDKFAMREFCRLHKLPVPEYKKCFSAEEAVEFFRRINKPVIIKPLDSNSSRGVFSISAEDDIYKHFETALSYSRIQKAVLLERYINGVEFTVDGIKTPKGHCSLAVSEKKHFSHNVNIASELYFTHDNPLFDYEKLKEINDLFVNESGLEFGLTHAEYKYEDGVFYLIEIASRGGGNRISSDIVPYMSGIDNYEYFIRCCLGDISSPEFKLNDEYKTRAAVLKFFEVPPEGGTVKNIRGNDWLESEPDIAAFKFNFKIGDWLSPAENDSARAGFYIALCESREKLDFLMHEVSRKVVIECV